MDKKRPMTENELEYYANLSDSEFDMIFGEEDGYEEDGNDSSDYEPSVNSSDSAHKSSPNLKMKSSPNLKMKSSPNLKMKLFPIQMIMMMNPKQQHQIRMIICGQIFNKILNYLFSKKMLV
ncbi:hypothetical protein JTB14_031559 [Gonioctena quinquepunctata]|nr:hypothetical protein JTB14_031559 [Gonioctena quinquepunctata]